MKVNLFVALLITEEETLTNEN